MSVVKVAALVAMTATIVLTLAGAWAARTWTWQAFATAARRHWIAVRFAVFALVATIASGDPVAIVLSGLATALAVGLAVVTGRIRDRLRDEGVREWSR